MFNPTPGKPDDEGNSPSKPDYQMPDSFSRDPDIDDEAYTYALESLLKGSKPSEIRKSLIDAGHTSSNADRIVQTAMKFRKQNEAVAEAAGSKNAGVYIVIGLCLWMIGCALRMGTSLGGALAAVILISDIIGLILIVMGIASRIRGRSSSR